MRVTLDDRPCGVEGDSIRTVLAEAAAKAEATGRVIVEVHVDGEIWGETELASAERCEATADEVVLMSADRADLVCRTLDDAADALTEIDSIQRASAEDLQVGRSAEGMQQLGGALELWLLVQRGIGMCLHTMNIELDDVEHDGEPVVRSIAALEDQLRTVRDALTKQDSITLADALLFELPEVIEHWRRVLDSLSAHVRRVAATQNPGDASSTSDPETA